MSESLTLPMFEESFHCLTEKHCGGCRDRGKRGQKFRMAWSLTHTMPGDRDDFDCPHGKPWNAESSEKMTSTEKVKHMSMLAKAKSYIKAEGHLLIAGPASKEVVAERRAVCEGCDSYDLKDKETGEAYCTACDCPSWRRARMKAKWSMAKAECPKGLWAVKGREKSHAT